MTETLWVEPRLRGLVVLADPRNPPSKVGQVILYEHAGRETGWCAFAPNPDGAVNESRLRTVSLSADRTARLAMERDFRRRVREGKVHHEFPPPSRGVRWAPLILLAVALVLVIAEVAVRMTSSPAAGVPALLAFMALFFSAMYLPASRVRTRRARLDGGVIDVELITGEVIRRPLADIERIRVWPMAASMRFRDGRSVSVYADKGHERRVMLALRWPHNCSPAQAQRREMRGIVRRCLLLYLPLASVPLGIVCGVAQIPVFGLPATSPWVGPVTGAAFYATFAAQFAFVMLLEHARDAVITAMRRRDRRRRARAVGPPPGVSPIA